MAEQSERFVKISNFFLKEVMPYYLNNKEILKKEAMDYKSPLAGCMEFLSYHKMYPVIQTFISELEKDPDMLITIVKSKILFPLKVGIINNWDIIPIIDDEFISNEIKKLAERIGIQKIVRVIIDLNEEQKNLLKQHVPDLLEENERLAPEVKKFIKEYRDDINKGKRSLI